MNEVEERPKITPASSDLIRVLGWVPLMVSLEAPLQQFTVRDLLYLQPGTVVQAAISQTAEVPLLANGKPIARAKLEVVGEFLKARITELL